MTSKQQPVSRRAWTAGVAATVVLGAAQSGGQQPPAEPAKPSDAELLTQILARQYPKNLGEPELAQIRGDLEGQLRRSATLSAFPLRNGDEPAPIFAAFRHDQ
jgi:hypothetical protein